MGDNLVIMLRHSPFASTRTFDALRSCVGLTMGDDPLTMVFVEDGVYTLSAKGKPVLPGFDWNKHLEMLKDLEFDLIVDKQSADERGVTEFNWEPIEKSRDEIADVLKNAKAIITY